MDGDDNWGNASVDIKQEDNDDNVPTLVDSSRQPRGTWETLDTKSEVAGGGVKTGGRHDSDSDEEPLRRPATRHDSDSDEEPPRRPATRHDSDSDESLLVDQLHGMIVIVMRSLLVDQLHGMIVIVKRMCPDDLRKSL